MLSPRPRLIVATTLSTLGLLACDKQTEPKSAESGISADSGAAPDTAGQDDSPPPADDVVEQAARPFTGYRTSDEETFTEEEMLTFIASADAICIGERHDQPLDHFAELRVIEGLKERRALRGFELGVGFEMIRAADQPTLNSFSEDKTSLEDLPGLLDFKNEWGFPFQYYAPQLEEAQAGGAKLVALGVEKSLTRTIAETGVASLNENERRLLPEFGPYSAPHDRLFRTLMKGHPGKPDALTNYYEAQIVWDEAMAETSAAWLAERHPGRKIIVLAGQAHCHASAIPERFTRRTGQPMVSLLPVAGGAPLKPAAQNEKEPTLDQQLAAGYDYQMVFVQ